MTLQRKRKRKKAGHQSYKCACNSGVCGGECRGVNLFRERSDKDMICPSAYLEN